MHRDLDAGTYFDDGIHKQLFGPSLVDVITRHTKRARNADKAAAREFEAAMSGGLPGGGRRRG